jgi:NADPH:quinone reductase-like Zn-dependent oxidoreductase/NAD(P)-dependent dehydrogenase (short-subunit alcohol dehydrogenase family)
MAPGHFATLEQVPEGSCSKLRDDEDLEIMASLPLPLSTATHAINDRARLQASDSVLFHCGSSSSDTCAVIAAISIAKKIGAQVFAVCSSTKEQQQLLQVVQLTTDHIFTINDASLSSKIRRATGNQGVDVVVSFSDEQLDASVFADCARLVQVGSGASGLADTVAANPSIMHRDITLTTFDMGNIIARQTPAGLSLRQKLLANALASYRSGDLKDLPLDPRIWDIADIASAFRALAPKKDEQGHHTSGVVVSLNSNESQIPVMPIKYDTVLSPEKSYLLVGCLGGLGRSMSKWMLSRGARKFVFMGRSGTDKTAARRLVENLQSLGAEVTVIRGDVVNADDVNRAVAGIHGPVGGVIQAAMGLDEALFTTMPRDYWLAGLRPKVTGSWNLYNALSGRERDLDFFLMTSSVSGSVGTATESNYCSANYFLDVFSRYLRSAGMPGVSVGLGMISEVGYLHENPEIEALLLRKGIQAINEDEMLQIIDIALSTASAAPIGVDNTYDEMSQGHVLTGLEPLGLKALRAQGFEGSSPVLGDPRAFVLSAALDESTDGTGAKTSTNGLPAEVADAIGAGSSVAEAVLTAVSQKFSSLVLIPVDKLDATKPISSVGVDSMLAAEFRTWIFQAFKVDVPYLTLLSVAATLDMLAEMIAQKVSHSE